MTTRIEGAVTITGRLSPAYLSIPNETIENAAIKSDAAIAATKLQQQYLLSYQQAPGTNVVAATHLLHIAKGAGELIGLAVRPITAPTGGDLAYTVDIQKAADASGTWTSLLDAPLEVSVAESSANNTIYAGDLVATPTYSAEDTLRIVIALSGSTGSQGQGLIVTATVREAAA